MIKSFLGFSGLYVMVRKQKIWCLSSYACVLSHFSCGHLFAVLCIVAHQDPMSMGFSRQLYWSRLPLPPPGDLPDSAIESASLISPALAGRFFTASTTWEVLIFLCCCSVAQLRPTLCDPMDCSTQCFPVLNSLLEFAQIHVHWVDDIIQPNHALLPPSLPALNLSQNQGLF